MNMNEQMKEKRNNAFIKLGDFLKQYGFAESDQKPKSLSTGGSLYGFLFDYVGNKGILYHERLIVVALDEVYLIGKHVPTNFTKWEIIEEYKYTSHEGLLILLEDLLLSSDNAKKLWGEH